MPLQKRENMKLLIVCTIPEGSLEELEAVTGISVDTKHTILGDDEDCADSEDTN